MKIFYSPQHALHNPPYEIFEGGLQVPYFEKPQRAEIILNALQKQSWAEILAPHDFGLAPLHAVHTADYLEFLQTAFAAWQREGSELGKDYSTDVLLPATFPQRRMKHKPQAIAGQAGYYSLDLNAPIVGGTFAGALSSAHCALSGAQALTQGSLVAYALCRPPGHHAGKDYCGGYCYLNNASIAAQFLNQRVAILDIDYHAGNGTQDIFYDHPEILTISIHGDPNYAYPYFAGAAAESHDHHLNYPLPAHTNEAAYFATLERALEKISAFAPRYLIVSVGMDIFTDDPLGTFEISSEGIAQIGASIAQLKLPTLVVQEGGYAMEALGTNVVNFLSAFV